MEPIELTQPLRSSQPSLTPNALIDGLRATAWTCASINASVCATYPPKLYVSTSKSQQRPKCQTQPITHQKALAIRHSLQITAATDLEQVTSHPALNLLATVNPHMNSFDLWELTTLYQEVIGSAYWLLQTNLFQRPYQIWPLPAHMVQITAPTNKSGFLYHFRGAEYQEHQIIHFRYPDPASPYYTGLSPLRAAFAEVAIARSYSELKLSRFDNRAAPDIIISPKEPTGPDERERLEEQWNQKFRRGGNGRALVAESDLSVQLLNGQMGDLALLAEKGRNSEDICNAFHVPLSMLSTNTNLANLQAADAQHATKCIRPRLIRRDEKLNEQLLPMFDRTFRLRFVSDDPTPPDTISDNQLLALSAQYGYATVNELRAAQNLPPVPWGENPCKTNQSPQHSGSSAPGPSV